MLHQVVFSGFPTKKKAEMQRRASIQGTSSCLLHKMLQGGLFITWKRARRAFGKKQNCKRLNCTSGNHGRVSSSSSQLGNARAQVGGSSGDADVRDPTISAERSWVPPLVRDAANNHVAGSFPDVTQGEAKCRQSFRAAPDVLLSVHKASAWENWQICIKRVSGSNRQLLCQ